MVENFRTSCCLVVLLCYAMTFIYIAKPSAFVCALRPSWPWHLLCCLLLSFADEDQQDCSDLGGARDSARRPRFISPASQVAICAALISAQLLVALIWLLVEAPGVRKEVGPDRRDVVTLKCNSLDSSMLVSLTYKLHPSSSSAPSMPSRPGSVQRISTRPSSLASPCTPPASSGWPFSPFLRHCQ